MAKNSKQPGEIETVTLTMSRPVAEAVKMACEMYLRLHMGQFEDLTENLCMAKFYSDLERNAFTTEEQRDDAFRTAIECRNTMRNGLNGLYKCCVLPAPLEYTMRIPYRAEIAWTTLRYALVWHDHPEGIKSCVDYYKPMNRSDQPTPTVKLSEVQNNTQPACDGKCAECGRC